jgi:hypothetical protein
MTGDHSGLVLGQTFQTAYVTTDMDRALAIFRERYGIGQFLRSGRRTIPLEPSGQMTMEIALAWAGDTMIEVIQPLADEVAVYADWLPREGFGLRFHHVAVRLHSTAEWNEMLRMNEKLGHRVCFRLTASNTKALYIDTAAELGHYVEYLLYLDPPNSSLPRIPQNIAGHHTKY